MITDTFFFHIVLYCEYMSQFRKISCSWALSYNHQITEAEVTSGDTWSIFLFRAEPGVKLDQAPASWSSNLQDQRLYNDCG